MAALRAAVLEVVTPERLKAVFERLLRKAEEGDTAAAKLVLAYSLGRPAGATNPDEVDLNELDLARRLPSLRELVLAANSSLWTTLSIVAPEASVWRKAWESVVDEAFAEKLQALTAANGGNPAEHPS